ncbi:aminoglycoside phosphotransferase family protein [Magnetospirillum sulfuroxidans]|uniref:Phosphotransferase n=1 Tax=Magnetospirillum sulfuroxidans TaxID=611300 RepID=A0ABS5ID73_9PROT|nr:phosphotransferase [Magnetospirillum sulfuroxidans]MBR9972373.1 phosphotransferase [Magnetospirillum sulfuroxidans]
MSHRLDLLQAFLGAAGWGAAERATLAGDASFRRYDRLRRGEERAVLMDAPPPQEDVRPFIRIARQLERLNYSAPRLLAEDVENGFLLLEDLGDSTYTRCLANGEDEEKLYALAMDVLADLHQRPPAETIPVGTPAYDDERLLTEACLLTDWYMPAVLGADTDPAARAEYCRLWRDLFPIARAVPNTLVLRDFHVDNLMLLDRPGLAACGLLDFQDAVAGPLTYDPMSLLEDARRDIDPAMIGRMKARYLARLPQVEAEAFAASWAVLAAQRHAKVIGIFTRLCERDGKSGYLIHIPRLWRLLEQSLAHPALAGIKHWLDIHMPQRQRTVPTP